MSRTEGVSLPRLPTSHVRVTSPKSIQPHSRRQVHHRRSVSEPSYTAYVGTPRQDIPHHVYHDAAMFDDVFDKQGKLLQNRNTPKITAPLNSIGYSSLHDPNCQKLFLNNKRLRSHLMNLGLITDDLRVVASTSEQRQKIRAHELLERKEQLLLKLEDQERQRIERLQRQVKLPRLYQESFVKAEERKLRTEQLQQMKAERLLKAEQDKRVRAKQRKEEERRKLQQTMEDAKLNEQAKRNAFRAQQEVSEIMAYERQYGKFGTQIANWHRESDRLHNRMIIMERKYWSHMRQQQWLSESYPPPSAGSQCSSSASSVVDVEETSLIIQSLSQQLSKSEAEELLPAVETTVEDERTLGMEEHETKVVETEASEPRIDFPEEILQGNGPDDVQLQEAAVEDRIKELTISDSGPHHMEEREGKERERVIAETLKMEDEAQPPREDQHEDNVGPDFPNEVAMKERETAAVQEVVTLDPDQSSSELSRILIDAFSRTDVTGSDFINLDDFIQVLNSRDLGLQLNENELLYLAEQADINKNGWIPFIQVTPYLPPLLLAIYSQRVELSMQHFGAYVEEQWCQLYTTEGGVSYFNKLTGAMQLGGRPDDFRPYLKDDAFEESIVDFFETADANKDGVVDYNDFYSLLISPMVSTRIYSNQMEELLALYQSYSIDDRMGLENFAPVAKSLLLMIYQNTYLDVDEWIELESRKSGTFWFNKITGETFLPQSSIPGGTVSSVATNGVPSSTAPKESGKTAVSKKRKKKYSRRVSWDDSTTSTQPAKTSAPPPLRRRQSKAKQQSSVSTEGENVLTVARPGEDDSDVKSESKSADNESETRQEIHADMTAVEDEEVKHDLEPSSQGVEEDGAQERPTETQIEETVSASAMVTNTIEDSMKADSNESNPTPVEDSKTEERVNSPESNEAETQDISID